MPTINIELTGISCGYARPILQAGARHAQDLLSEGLAVNYTCNRNSTDFMEGSIRVGGISSDTPVMTWVAGLYIFCALALLAALFYLYRRDASARDFFYWGGLSLTVPFLGPLITLILYRFTARNDG